jgi:carotenoid cleavage dioxygenase
MTSMTTTNPYLEGNFGPVRDELTVLEVPVTGSIPEHLDGRYLRNGPNPPGDPDPATYHWFLGDGMVHGLRIRDGRVEWYRNRFVRSANVAAALGEPTRPGRIHADFDFSANTHVVGHAGRTFAIVEGGSRPYELDDELDTIGPCDFDGTLSGGYTAHPLRDPETGELHAVSYYWGWGNKVQYSVIDAAGRVRRTVDIEVGGSPMMHAFTLTEHNVIIYDLPVTFDARKATSSMPAVLARPGAFLTNLAVGRRPVPERVAKAVSKHAASGVFPYSWDPDYRSRIGVMPRHGGADDVRWVDVEPCYVYHPLNGYDVDGGVVLDVTRHPKTFATEHRGPSEGHPTLERWTVDLRAGKVIEERLDDRGHEFPRMDERLIGRRHRFGYSVGVNPDDAGIAPAFQDLIRYDLAAGSTNVRSFGDRYELDEFVFIPNDGGSAEDDGVLMGFVYDREADRSELTIVDAVTLETVASASLPARVPHGFHGSWVPSP